jgi:hypothetical protein
LPSPTEKLVGINHTGEFSPRRRAYDVPADAPPEHVRLKLRAEVEDSLRDVCGNWPTGEFDRIVADITATAMKYHGRERRRQTPGSTRSVTAVIPGASALMSFVLSATHSVQRFLSTDRLPSG